MALWNKNDGEASKPNWLTEEQKRQCFRTTRGWEIPLMGFEGVSGPRDFENIYGQTSSNTGLTSVNQTIFRSSTYIGPTELLVCMPFDISVTGSTSTNMAGFPTPRGGSTADNASIGKTAGNAVNYAPYFTSPLTGDTIYVVAGLTSYIPIIVADYNYCDLPRTLAISVTGQTSGVSLSTSFTAGTFQAIYPSPLGTAGNALQGITLAAASAVWFNQPTYAKGMTNAWNWANNNYELGIPHNRYGGWGGITQGAAVLVVRAGPTSGNNTVTLFVSDLAIEGAQGLTGSVTFTLSVTGSTSF